MDESSVNVDIEEDEINGEQNPDSSENESQSDMLFETRQVATSNLDFEEHSLLKSVYSTL